jgi:AcrR family transcriptional regulator
MKTESNSGSAGAGRATDRRARRREQLRDHVYNVAIGLIVERGFDNTTMDEIAERADVARATVFNHFERKTAFIDEWAVRRRERALQRVHAKQLGDHEARDALEASMIELARVNTTSRTESVALMTAAVHTTNVLGHPALADDFADFLARAQDAGQIAQSLDPQLVGLLLATGYFAVLTAWIEDDPAPFNLQERLLGMLYVILDGAASACTCRTHTS